MLLFEKPVVRTDHVVVFAQTSPEPDFFFFGQHFNPTKWLCSVGAFYFPDCRIIVQYNIVGAIAIVVVGFAAVES
jgi:hypothetical protein